MTITQALKLSTAKLSINSIDSPHPEAELLLAYVLKNPREFLLAHGEKKLSPSKISNFKFLISRRLKGEPLAYLIGRKEFYGLDFKVNQNVLIPRPETELMVEEALKLTTRNSQRVTLVDVGTGSGCIIISLLKQLQNYKLPITPALAKRGGTSNYKFLALDISAKALSVARQNAKHHGINKNIKFIKGDLLQPIINKLNSTFDIRHSTIVVANLPYLTSAQIKHSPTIKHEPKSALSGGPDGLKYYRQLFRQLKKLRVVYYALCEFDPRQTAKMKKLIKQCLPNVNLQIKKDICGHNRLIMIKNA